MNSQNQVIDETEPGRAAAVEATMGYILGRLASAALIDLDAAQKRVSDHLVSAMSNIKAIRPDKQDFAEATKAHAIASLDRTFKIGREAP